MFARNHVRGKIRVKGSPPFVIQSAPSPRPWRQLPDPFSSFDDLPVAVHAASRTTAELRGGGSRGGGDFRRCSRTVVVLLVVMMMMWVEAAADRQAAKKINGPSLLQRRRYQSLWRVFL
jgi:hypothetical protein